MYDAAMVLEQKHNKQMQQLSYEGGADPHPLLLFNSFHVRYEDDTEKANDKKAAQFRNKVKRNWKQKLVYVILASPCNQLFWYFQKQIFSEKFLNGEGVICLSSIYIANYPLYWGYVNVDVSPKSAIFFPK